ncbi:symplekin isoform X1 [Tanacetum coccineum]
MNGVPGKRAKPTPNLNEDSKGNVVGNSSSQKVNADNGRAQQLVAMCSSLVAQGEQCAGMLEILISSISADLLAQVVMANMPNLPLARPTEDGNEELVNTGSHPDNLSAYLTDMISRSTNSQLTDSTLETQTDEGEQPATKDSDVVHSPQASPMEEDLVPAGPPVSVNIPSVTVDAEMISADMEENNQEQITKTGTSSVDIVPSMSTDKSEELSPKAAMAEANNINSSNATSVQLTSKVILPKMAAPVISLTDEQKDHIQKLAFTRIIAVAGGSQLRFSLLSYLGVEGHELTLRVLYRLFGEAEADHDFFSSTTATSVYEMFLLKVAETLRDSFPPNDKSLTRLLSEVPYLPKPVLKLLESLCVLGNSEKDAELHSGERVHQGLSIVWSLILLRPPTRDVCLKIALQCTTWRKCKQKRYVWWQQAFHYSSYSSAKRSFAKDMLLSAVNDDHLMDKAHNDGSNAEVAKDNEMGKPMTESASAIVKDSSSDSGQASTSDNNPSTSIIDAQRCINTLFRQLLIVYKNMSKAAKQAISVQIPKLVRTIGSSPQLLEIIADPPAGSETLLMQVVQTLTDGALPSPNLIATITKLYDTKLRDTEILIPVLPFLPKDEIFPRFVNLPSDKFQAALARIFQESSQGGSILLTYKLKCCLVSMALYPERDGSPLERSQVTDACNTCFHQRQIFTQQVLAKVLNQLVEQIPLPMLFMRTVIQTIGAFPALVDFIMEILSRLVSKQIWKNQKLWVGFLKCAQLTKPQSFGVLLQLPPAQLEIALTKQPVLKGPLVSYASQPDIRSSLPRFDK